MARTGRFGRLPAAAPDLTAQIVNLYEQYEAERDRNIVDAWQNGGEFEGRPVNDQRMLEWFHMRREQVGRDDPNWDYWNDQLRQTEFHIAEQKANLEYTRTSDKDPVGSNTKMRDFYKEWAGKLPRASAAWRDLMTSAARFAKAARAAASAGSAASKAAAEKAHLLQVMKNTVKPGMGAIYAIENAARDLGLNAGFNLDLTATAAADITNNGSFDEALANVQMSAPQLIHDLRMKQADGRSYAPGWDGVLDGKHMLGQIDKAIDGYRRMAKIAQSYGDDTNAKAYRKAAGDLVSTRVRWKTIVSDNPDKYLALRTQFYETVQNAHDPIEAASAYDAYAKGLDKLANDEAGFGDLGMAGQLRNEAVGARGGKVSNVPTYFEDAGGTTTGPNAGTETAPGSKPGTEAQAIMLSAVDTLNHATGLADGTMVMQIVADNSAPSGERVVIIPKGSMQAAGGGNPVYPMEIATTGGSFTDDKGKVHTFPASTMTQAVVAYPVMVGIPKSALSDPDAQVGPGLTPGASLLGSSGQTRQVGWYVPLGHGEAMWATNTGPGGTKVWSDTPPFVIPGEQGSIKLSTDADVAHDGVFNVEYSLPYLQGLAGGTALDMILQAIPAMTSANKPITVTDPVTGEKTTKVSGYTFNPPALENAPAQYLPPDTTATPPTTPSAPATPTAPAPAVAGDQHPDQPYQWQGPPGSLPPGATGLSAPGPDGIQHFMYPDTSRPNAGGLQDLTPSSVPFPGATGSGGLGPVTVTGGPGQQPGPAAGGKPQYAPTGQSSGYVPTMTAAEMATQQANADSAAKQAAAQQASFDYFAALEHIANSDLVTNPVHLGWLDPTLTRAAKTPTRRSEFAQKDPLALWQKMTETNPLLLNDPTLAQAVFSEMDVLRKAGQSGVDEANFTYARAIAAGSNSFLAGINLGINKTNALNTPTVAQLYNDYSHPKSVYTGAGGVFVGTGYDTKPATAPQPIQPQIKTADAGSAMTQLSEQSQMIAASAAYSNPQPTAVMPSLQVGSAASTATKPITPALPKPTPTQIKPLIPKTPKPPKPPVIKMPKPPKPLGDPGGSRRLPGGRYQS